MASEIMKYILLLQKYIELVILNYIHFHMIQILMKHH